jgi:tRNA dimethylallyltransferase
VSTPDRPFNAGVYAGHADRLIPGILERGRYPLFVGGTGLYARALLYGLASIPEVPAEIRESITRRMTTDGPAALHARLAEVDPVTAARLPPADSQRISRALEVFEATGRPISEFQEEHRFAARRYRYVKLCVTWPRPALRQRIVDRVPGMFAAGFVGEVEALLAAGYSPELRTFKALGYREVIEHIRGRLALSDCIERVTLKHLQYSRRQETWFSGESDAVRFEVLRAQPAFSAVEDFLARD